MSMTPGQMGDGDVYKGRSGPSCPQPGLLDPELQVEGLQAGVQPPPVQDLTHPPVLIA